MMVWPWSCLARSRAAWALATAAWAAARLATAVARLARVTLAWFWLTASSARLWSASERAVMAAAR